MSKIKYRMIQVPFELLSIKIQKRSVFGWKTVNSYSSRDLADHDFDILVNHNAQKILRKI